MRNIGIIGAGEIGTALGGILKRRNVVDLWDKDSAKSQTRKDLSHIVKEAGVVFLCVPSWAMTEVLEKIRPAISNETIVVSLAKGMLPGGVTMDQLLGDILPNQAILAGPMLAEELNQLKPSVGVIAGPDKDVFNVVEMIFGDSNLKLTYTSDFRGAALAGVTKNVYSIALGISDCLNLGSNVKGWLTVKSLEEMVKVVGFLGGKAETVRGLAGLGDLIATGFSPYSLNHAVGEQLVKTGKCSLVSEGLVSLDPLAASLDKFRQDLPLLFTLLGIKHHPGDTEALFNDFIKKYA